MRRRFDIVVFNFHKLDRFLAHLWRLRGFEPARDRITIVSSSATPEEAEIVDEFERQRGFAVRYLPRHNRGLAELARAEYFTGAVGGRSENLRYPYVFQMQDHYLDTEGRDSVWDTDEPGVTVPRGDTVPDEAVFDLGRMEELAGRHGLDGFFCDRQDPALYTALGRRFVAPTGGNFAIRSDRLAERRAQRAFRRLIRSCDDTYRWAIYAEVMWGRILFAEGRRFYDLKRDRIFDRWPGADFPTPAPGGFRRLRALYALPEPLRAAALGASAARRRPGRLR